MSCLFDAAWWPSILTALKDFKCPKNLYYYLTQNYFCERTATSLMNTYKIKRIVSKGCPQGSYCEPVFWNIQYNSLLDTKFTTHSRAIAFADELILLTKDNSVLEIESYANVELSEISKWSSNNKIQFSE